MPRLLQRVPGVVVLHDFFLSGLFWTIQAHNPQGHAFSSEIEYSHGHLSLLEHLCAGNIVRSLVRYPCNLAILENATGVISHSHYSKGLSKKWYGEAAPRNWAVIPLLMRNVGGQNISKNEARKRLGIADDAFVVCSFGIVHSAFKLNDRILEAWAESQLGKTQGCSLVFVGDCGDEAFNGLLLRLTAEERINNCTVTGYASDTDYQLWLSACDLCVQLRAKSRGETSGAVSDGMAAGKHVILNAHAALCEIPDDVVTKLPENPSSSDLVKALRFAFSSPQMRTEIGDRARAYTVENHSVEVIAAQYRDALEEFSNHNENHRLRENFAELRKLERKNLSRYELSELRSYMDAIRPDYRPASRLLIDITRQLSDPGFFNLGNEERKKKAFFLGLIPENKRIFFVTRSENGRYEILRDLPDRLSGTLGSLDGSEPMPIFPDEVPLLWEEFSGMA
jgi:glycosyltransferase involved in cell wall biosynthesis